jgi:hypothetical protein
MKRGTPEHPKTKMLAKRLGLKKYQAVGLLESLWHFTANFAKRGDIGRWSNDAIASDIDWDGEADYLIQVLIDCGFIETCKTYRLLIHDWPTHAGQTVERSPEVKKLGFAKRTLENSSLPTPTPTPTPTPSKTPTESMSASADGEAIEPPSKTGEATVPPEASFESEFLEAWNATSGSRHARAITDKRRRNLRSRAREPCWREAWRNALAKFPLACFCDPTGWKPDVDWFLRPDTVSNILEGKYDWKKSNGKQPERSGGGQRYAGD